VLDAGVPLGATGSRRASFGTGAAASQQPYSSKRLEKLRDREKLLDVTASWVQWRWQRAPERTLPNTASPLILRFECCLEYEAKLQICLNTDKLFSQSYSKALVGSLNTRAKSTQHRDLRRLNSKQNQHLP